MRLFVAVDLPPAVHDWAREAAATLRSRLSHSASRVTWVNPDRLHLTLVFLGEVADAVGQETMARFGTTLEVPRFWIRLGTAGAFPSTGRPRVVWLGIEEGAAGLAAARCAVLARLDGVPFQREKRPFAPHLTIARFKDGGSKADRQTIAASSIDASSRGEVDHVTLYRSRLSPRGPDYTALAQAPLALEDRT